MNVLRMFFSKWVVTLLFIYLLHCYLFIFRDEGLTIDNEALINIPQITTCDNCHIVPVPVLYGDIDETVSFPLVATI